MDSYQELYESFKNGTVFTGTIHHVRKCLQAILDINTSLTDDPGVNSRSFALVSKSDMATWRWYLESTQNEDTVRDFLRVLASEWQLRPFIEFLLLHVMINRSGKTFKDINNSIRLKQRWWILAERYLLWAMNHTVRWKNPTFSGKISAFIGPHELEPKSTAKKQPGLGCDAFTQIWFPGESPINFGVQFGVTLTKRIELQKIRDLNISRIKLQDTSYLKKIKRRYLPRHIPERFMLFHAENILQKFTNGKDTQKVIEAHMRWFEKWQKTGTPIDSLDDVSRGDILHIQSSFETALWAWKEFETRYPHTRWSAQQTTFKIYHEDHTYSYTAHYDPRDAGLRRSNQMPIRVEIKLRDKKTWWSYTPLYSLFFFQ